MMFFYGIRETPEQAINHLDEIGGPHSHTNYPWGWAQAGNTPFKWYKQNTHEGGVHVPLVVHWPEGLGDVGGELRHQFHHVNDIAPTIYEASGVTPFLEQCDTGEAVHVHRLLARAPGLGGVWHAAGVLSDATLPKQDENALASVYAPKAHGAQRLHSTSVANRIHIFDLCSSVVVSFAHVPQHQTDRRHGTC